MMPLAEMFRLAPSKGALGSCPRDRFDGLLNPAREIPPGQYAFIHWPQREIQPFIEGIAIAELKVDFDKPITDFHDPHYDKHNSARKLTYQVPDHPFTIVQLCYRTPSSKTPDNAYLIRCGDADALQRASVRFVPLIPR